jgi:BD-FAE protein
VDLNKHSRHGALLGLIAAVGIAQAQVPADIEAGLRKIGQIVDPACTAKLYRPLMPKNDVNSNATPLYPGITVARDVSFGPHPKDLVDIFTADKGSGNRTVLIYVPGGGGNKTEQQDREANAFYDNIGRWGTKNGMVVVTMQRHPGQNWDDPAKDVSAMIQWVEANIGKYKGNPEQMFIWAHSAGNGPLGTYIGRPEVWGPKGVGVRGAILMSGQWNIAPLEVAGAGGRGGRGAGNAFGGAGSTCGQDGPNAPLGIIAGPSGVNPELAPAGRGGRAGALAPVDAATQEARSTLPEYKKTKVKLLFVSAELDPGINGAMSPFYQTLHAELCKEGPAHCPTMLFAKDESHMSEVFSIDTDDKNVSGPILAWMKKVK